MSKAIGIIIMAQTRALMQFAAAVLGREATSEDVETVTRNCLRTSWSTVCGVRIKLDLKSMDGLALP